MTDNTRFFIKDRLTINDVCRTHGQAFDAAMTRMLQKGYPLAGMRHLFDDDNEEFVIYDNKGYHIAKAFTGEGRIEMNVHWGEFVPQSHGIRKWVDKSEEGIWLPN